MDPVLLDPEDLVEVADAAELTDADEDDNEEEDDDDEDGEGGEDAGANAGADVEAAEFAAGSASSSDHTYESVTPSSSFALSGHLARKSRKYT